jgi:hypothetical protein
MDDFNFDPFAELCGMIALLPITVAHSMINGTLSIQQEISKANSDAAQAMAEYEFQKSIHKNLK